MQSSCGIVDDIEDMLKQEGQLGDLASDDFNRANNKSFILPKRLRKPKSQASGENGEDKEEEEEDKEEDKEGDKEGESQDEATGMSNVPGVASIYIKTWGCTHNGSDGEYMAGQLAAYGYQLTDEPARADLWLLNSCTVKK